MFLLINKLSHYKFLFSMKKITKNEKFGKLENGISSVIGHSSGKCPIVCFS